MLPELDKEQFSELKIYEGIFAIFETEFKEIGNFVAFSDGNLGVYSNKIHELHLRVCSEIENVLKIVIHKHFMSVSEIKEAWDTKKSEFLTKKELLSEYEVLKVKLNRNGKEDLDKYLFGFPDFSFYFGISCEKFNLNKKTIYFKSSVSSSSKLQKMQPFSLQESETVPSWWTNYNKLKHNKIESYSICNLGDLIKSMSGLYILMNYLLKYQPGNKSIQNRNYKHFKFSSIFPHFDVEFCSFQCKFFEASNTYQDLNWSMYLPPAISEDEYTNKKFIDLHKNFKAGFTEDSTGFSHLNEVIQNIDLSSIDYRAETDQVFEESIFYTFVNYQRTTDVNDHQIFRKLQHFGRFVN